MSERSQDQEGRRGVLGRLAARARQRPDSEVAQGLVRIAVYAALFGPVVHYADPGVAIVPMALMCSTAVALAALLLALALVDLRASPARRVTAMVVDMTTCTLSLHAAGSELSFSLMIYVWVTVAYGLRYGLGYLALALVMGQAGLAFLAFDGRFWSEHREVTGGFAAGYAVLSLYVGALIRQLEQARDAAEAAGRARSRFVAGVSHEIRTPLTAIVGAAEGLERRPLADVDAGRVRLISQSAHHLLALVNNVLDFAKADSAPIQVERRSVELGSLLREVFEEARVQALAKGLQAQLILDADLPARATTDPVRVHQVLTNLLGNAVRYTRHGSMRLIAERGDGGSGLRLRVQDTGVGIAPAQQARIFKPFVRGSASEPDRGAGLGLAITRELVDLLQGTITVSSAPGRGSEFALQLPLGDPCPAADEALGPVGHRVRGAGAEGARIAAVLARAGARVLDGPGAALDEDAVADVWWCRAGAGAAAEIAPSAVVVHLGSVQDALAAGAEINVVLAPPWTEERISTAAQLAAVIRTPRAVCAAETDDVPALRVLVADDSDTNRLVLRDMLGGAGHVVEPVGDGAAAVERVEEEDFDLAVLDMYMPRCDGLEATRRIRAGPAGDLPVLVLTADADPATKRACIAAGADAYLTKPVTTEALLRAAGELGARRPPLVESERALRFLWPQGPASAGAPGARARLAAFAQEMEQLIGECRRALQVGDAAALRRTAHRLAGSAQMVGAPRLARLAERARVDGAGDLPDTLQRVLAGTRAGFDALLSDVPAEPTRPS